MLLSSAESNEKTIMDQRQDYQINCVKNLITLQGDKKTKINEFESAEHRVLYKQYDALRVIEDLLYWRPKMRMG